MTNTPTPAEPARKFPWESVKLLLPADLHAWATRRAQAEGVSLEVWLEALLAAERQAAGEEPQDRPDDSRIALWFHVTQEEAERRLRLRGGKGENPCRKKGDVFAVAVRKGTLRHALEERGTGCFPWATV